MIKKLKINGFGKFKLLNKRSRYGRNPKTGEEFEIKARKVVTFYPSINIKKKINNENKDYKTIGEVAKEISINTHTLRFWEKNSNK